MLNRRFTVSAGVLLVVFSAVAYLAINMDDSRFLSNSSVQTAAPEAPVFFQQVQPNNALTGGLTFNFTKFNNLTQGIVNQKFNQNQQRIETHILTDRVVYSNGDLLLVNVLVNDAFTKQPLSVNLSSANLANFLVTVDLYDDQGILVWQDTQYALATSADFVTVLPYYGLTTGTYTLRAYGQNVAPSYRQIRVNGDIAGVLNDFNVTTRLDRDTYLPGQNVTVTVAIPFSPVFNTYNSDGLQSWNVSYIYYVRFENLQYIVGKGSIRTNSSNPTTTITFTVPRGTSIRQNLIYLKTKATQEYSYYPYPPYPVPYDPATVRPVDPPVRSKLAVSSDSASESVARASVFGFSTRQSDAEVRAEAAQQQAAAPSKAHTPPNAPEGSDDRLSCPRPYAGRAVDYIPCGQFELTNVQYIPLRIRSQNINTVFWTESNSALVQNVTHRVYYYSYFGEASDFPSQRAFLYPYTGLAQLTVNSTTRGVVTTVRRNLTSTYSGIASFNLSTRVAQQGTTVVASLQIVSPDVPTQTFNFPVAGLLRQVSDATQNEIYFSLRSNNVRNTDNITVFVQTNGLVSNRSIYLLQVLHKERVAWQGAYNFQPNANRSIDIPSSQIAPCQGGCIQQVVLSLVTSNWTTFDASNAVLGGAKRILQSTNTTNNGTRPNSTSNSTGGNNSTNGTRPPAANGTNSTGGNSTGNSTRPNNGTNNGTNPAGGNGTGNNTRPPNATNGTNPAGGNGTGNNTRPPNATNGTTGGNSTGNGTGNNTRPPNATNGTAGGNGTRPNNGTNGTAGGNGTGNGTRPNNGTNGTAGGNGTGNGTRPTNGTNGTTGGNGTGNGTRPNNGTSGNSSNPRQNGTSGSSTNNQTFSSSDFEIVASWLSPRGSQAVFRQSTLANLNVNFTSDKASYVPSDLVNYRINVTSAGSAILAPTFVNLIVTDESSNRGLSVQDAQTNIQGRLLENEFSVASVPFFDYNAVFTQSRISQVQLDAYLQSQFVRTEYSNFRNFGKLLALDESAHLGDIFNAQRYFGSSLGISIAATYRVRPFAKFQNIVNNVFLGLGQVNVPPVGAYQIPANTTTLDASNVTHQFNPYYQYTTDWTQTVAWLSGVPATNGLIQGRFFLNDFQTTYSVYAEAYTTNGQSGVFTARNALSTVRSNPVQPLQVPAPNVTNYLVHGDSQTVQTTVTNNFNFPVNVSLYANTYYYDESNPGLTFNYSSVPTLVPAGRSVTVGGTIQASSNGYGQSFVLGAVLFNNQLGVNVTFETYDYVSIIPNAFYNAIYQSGVIGTNFTGDGASRNSTTQQFVLPNNSYWESSYAQAQFFGLNEDILKLIYQGQSNAYYSNQQPLFEDVAAATYLATLINAYVQELPDSPQDVLEWIQYDLYSLGQYVLPQYQNADGGFKQFANSSSELRSAQALIYLSLLRNTYPEALSNNTNNTMPNYPVRPMPAASLRNLQATNGTNGTRPNATNSTTGGNNTNSTGPRPNANGTNGTTGTNNTVPSNNGTNPAGNNSNGTRPNSTTGGNGTAGNNTGNNTRPPTNGTNGTAGNNTRPPTNGTNGTAGNNGTTGNNTRPPTNGTNGTRPNQTNGNGNPSNPTPLNQLPILNNLVNYINRLRNTTSGIYRIATTSASDPSHPTNPLLVQAYITYAISLSALRSGNFNAELNYLEAQVNATLSANTANRTSDPLLLSLASVALYNFGRLQSSARLATYLAQYQAADGRLTQSTSYSLANQPLFGSSERDRQVELAAYAAQAFALNGLNSNAMMANKFISTQVVEGTFGGNQATIAGASTIITQLQNFRAPTDMSRFGLFANQVLLSKSLPYNPKSMDITTIYSWNGPDYFGVTPELMNQAGIAQGATLNAQVGILGTKWPTTEDIRFGYTLGGYYLDSSVRPSSSQLSLSINQTYTAGQLGSAALFGRNVVVNVTVRNTGRTPLANINLYLGLPSCLQSVDSANAGILRQVVSFYVDYYSGTAVLGLAGLAAGASTTLRFTLQGSAVGACAARQVVAFVGRDPNSLVSQRFLQ